jgi:hypothetical protein
VLSQVPWIGMENLDRNGSDNRKFGFTGEDKKETVEV